MTPESQPIFFIDWCLGKTVANALKQAGACIEHHGDHFAPNTPDIEWLAEIGEKSWIILTKDGNIGRNELEIQVVARANARVFILVSGNLTRRQMAATFVAALEKIKKFVQGNQAPFIAKIYKDGKVQLWRSHTQLLKLLKAR